MAPMLDDDRPDRKYWTPYDHFMAERDAQREYVRRLMRRHGRALANALRATAVRLLNAASIAARPVRPRA